MYHSRLGSAHHLEEKSSYKGCDYLRKAYRTVEQTEIRSHVLSVKGVGKDSERKCEHRGPCEPDEEIRDEQYILIMYEHQFVEEVAVVVVNDLISVKVDISSVDGVSGLVVDLLEDIEC